ncbi:acyl carrier protein (plasmid) [Rhizobium sp. ACO-34A]|nr:acyl carrier protein [Rhizobium sp. ACO-34A]ATN37849.1 acyl carrier protein [Rhizobium sp. ACO-34A]
MGHISLRVKTIIASYLDISAEEVVDTASLADDLGADSLEIMEMIMRLEEEFGLDIGDDVIEKISTVGDAIKYLESMRA